MKIGIIIPCFNEGLFIASCLESIIVSIESVVDKTAQFQIIVCNNNSDDDSKFILNTYSKRYSFIRICEEQQKGPGYARSKAARLAFETMDWIILIDADCTAPRNWASIWHKAIKNTTCDLLTGYAVFPDNFEHQFPNAYKIIKATKLFLQQIRDVVGVINIAGHNHAVRKDCFEAIGGYPQPTKNDNGEVNNIAGSDWDFGTKARLLTKNIGYIEVKCVHSDRRASIDILEYITGRTYEGVFEHIRERFISNGIDETTISQLLKLKKLRFLRHFLFKVILVQPSLLTDTKVSQFLGEKIVFSMKKWLKNNKVISIYENRNGFIFDTLEDFSTQFGLPTLEYIEANINASFKK